jgi:hypothetical protein
MSRMPQQVQPHGSPLGDVPGIPPVIPSLDVDLHGRRQRILTTGAVWAVRQSADGGDLLRLEVGALAEASGSFVFSARAGDLLRLYLAERLRKRKAATVQGDTRMLLNFRRWAGRDAATDIGGRETSFDWSDLTEGMARAYLAHGLTTGNAGNYFSRLRHFYAWGVAKQFPDFQPALLRTLRSMRAPGNVKGAAVRFRHPERGPFDAQELRALREAAVHPDLSAQDRAVLRLHLEWGTNPNQLARLVNGDLKAYPSGVDPRDYKLFIPRNKKRTAQREVRARRISPRLGQLLRELQKGEEDDPLLHWLDAEHPTRSLRDALKRIRRLAGIRSARTGKRLAISPRRFRYTLGSEAAAQGGSDEAIAAVLDHSDTQHVRVYTQFTAQAQKRASQALDGTLQPIADAFLGRVVAQRENPFPDLPPQVIPGSVPYLPAFPLDLGGVGLCGHDVSKHGLCKFMPPLQCYRCRKFAAYRNGPHAEVLAALDQAREHLQQGADPRIAAQLDEICTALRQLLEQIESEAAPALVQIQPGRRGGGA